MEKFHEKINVTKSFLPPLQEYIEMLEIIWENNWLTNNGKLHSEFELKLKQHLKVRNTTLFTNGHLALDIAIKSMNLTGEVITTPFTFASTTHAITMNGLTPVFCDINDKDFTIDVSKIEELITDKTSAIIAVHVFGYPCNVKEIERIANKYNLKVIYDAAHCFGVEIDGVGIGNFGDVSMFSMHATKVFHSIEGGVLTYNNDNLKKTTEMYKNFGITGPEDVEIVGLNAKMNEFQAAMGLVNLNYIEQELKKRRVIANKYREEFSKIEGIHYLEDLKNVKHNYSYFPIIIDESKLGINRNKLYTQLKKYNIYTRKYFYPLVTDYECYKNKYDNLELINSKKISQNILIMPIYGELIVEDILNSIKYVINNHKL